MTDELVQKKTSVWQLVAGLVLVTLMAYLPSFRGAFVFDDPGSLIDNPTIEHLWPITGPLSPPSGQGLTVEGRPILNLSFAINWAISRYDSTYSYHVVNFIIHVLAALAFFGLVRRTLLLERWGGRFDSCAGELALAIAAIWAIHPLQTESVTYVVQRAESLMGLFYLATLYFALRAFTDKHDVAWAALAVLVCALGMGTKEVMVSAPLAVLFFDRFFLFGSFRQALRRRWKLYAGLAITWVILGYEVSRNATRSGTAGFTGNISPWDYLQTQMVFITHYLGLTFWPSHFVLDYGINLITGFQRVWPYGAFLIVLLLATLVAIRYRSWLGYLGILFWMMLAPTSSFVPNINQVAAEHRMYLPLAPVVAAVVIGAFLLYRRWVLPRIVSEDSKWMLNQAVPCVALLAVVIALGVRTWKRNTDYTQEAMLWNEVVRYYPDNPRGYQTKAAMFANVAAQFEKRAAKETDKQKAQECRRKSIEIFEEAVFQCTEAIKHKPDWALAYADRGADLTRLGRHDEAIRDYTKAIELDPRLARAYSGRGMSYVGLGRKAEAMKDFNLAIQYHPHDQVARFARLGLLLEQGNLAQGRRECEELLRINADHAGALRYMGDILRYEGRPTEGLTYVQKSLEFEPDVGATYLVRASIMVDLKRFSEARQDLSKAYQLGQARRADIEESLRTAISENGRK